MRGWPLIVALLSAVVLVPLLTVAASFLQPTDEVWAHFSGAILGGLVSNTAILLACVLSGTGLLGVGLAWLTAACEFPGRRRLEWALILPFAFPTYVMGYVMLDLLGISGPVQRAFVTGWGGVPGWYPDMSSVWGVALVMTLAFYPYVYLLARNAFRTHGRRAMEAARALGHPPLSAFFRVALPMARPWIFGGLLLVAMETLADFGTVTIFNYDTFTTAIYKAWLSMFSLPTAARMATILLLIAMAFLALDRLTRAGKRYYPVVTAPAPRLRLDGYKGLAALSACVVTLGLGFFLPLGRLAWWSAATWSVEADRAYLTLMANTVYSGLTAAFLIGLAALVLSYALRVDKGKPVSVLAGIATMGYALPGTVLAVGVYIPLAWLDNHLLDLLERLGWRVEVLINGTLAVMMMAYFVRFLAVAFQPINASLERIKPNLDESAASLGYSKAAVLWRIHFPMVRTGLVTAMLLVLIDVMKEMPITLMTRPFDWDTLSIRIFELTSEGDYERAALPSAILVLTGLVPVLFLARFSESARDRET